MDNPFENIVDRLEELEARLSTRLTAIEGHLRAHGAPTDPNEMIDKREAAKLLSVTTTTVDNYARAGKLQKHELGPRAVRFRKIEVLDLVKKREARR